jgi:AcrR family transcriptional regulator
MSSASAPRPGPRPRYTREQVLEAALRVIDREPPEAFTMRRVADELGMGVMTLYGYVSSKGEILAGVTTLVLSEQTPDSEAPWDERLRADVQYLYDICRRHPHLVTLVLAQAGASPGLFRLRERMLGTLLDAGLDEDAALHALGALTSYALGFGALGHRSTLIDLTERIRELPPDEFPRLAHVADRYAEHLSDAAFEHGLDLLLRGLGSAPS